MTVAILVVVLIRNFICKEELCIVFGQVLCIMLSIGGVVEPAAKQNEWRQKEAEVSSFKIDLYYSYTYVETDPPTRMKMKIGHIMIMRNSLLIASST